MLLQNAKVGAQPRDDPAWHKSEVGQGREVANKYRAFGHNSGVFTVGLSQVFILQKRAGRKSDIRRDGVGCQDTVGMGDIDHALRLSLFFQNVAELVNVDLDLWLELMDRAQSKEIFVDADATTVDIMILCSERHLSNTGDLVVPRILLQLSGSGVEFVVEFWVINVNFMGVDSNNGTCSTLRNKV